MAKKKKKNRVKVEPEVAESLGVSLRMVQRLRREGRFESAVRSSVGSGRPWMLDEAEVAEALEEMGIYVPGS